MSMQMDDDGLDAGDKQRLIAQKPACFDKLVLDPTSQLVAIWIIIIIIFSLVSTLLAAYFSCFGEPTRNSLIIFETVMEISFGADIVRNFFTAYFDPRDPRKKIKDLF